MAIAIAIATCLVFKALKLCHHCFSTSRCRGRRGRREAVTPTRWGRVGVVTSAVVKIFVSVDASAVGGDGNRSDGSIVPNTFITLSIITVTITINITIVTAASTSGIAATE